MVRLAFVKFERRTDKITLHQHPDNPEYWRLDLPAGMASTHLHTVKKILQGRSREKAYNPDSMRNPEAMEVFLRYLGKHTAG